MALSFTTGFAAAASDPFLKVGPHRAAADRRLSGGGVVLLVRPRGLFGKKGIFE